MAQDGADKQVKNVRTENDQLRKILEEKEKQLQLLIDDFRVKLEESIALKTELSMVKNGVQKLRSENNELTQRINHLDQQLVSAKHEAETSRSQIQHIKQQHELRQVVHLTEQDRLQKALKEAKDRIRA